MSAYVIYRATVTDPEGYEEYKSRAQGVIAKYGGKFIVRGGRTVTLEGDEETARVVVIEFSSFEQALDYYNSSDYQEAMSYRKDAAQAQMVVVDGV